MATTSGKGSILYKLLIVIFAIALIIVIKIPQKIWNEEKLERTTAQYNMSSIYEAEKFYHKLTNKYTTDADNLLKVVKQDSTLYQNQQLVKSTKELVGTIDDFMSVPMVEDLLKISQNLDNILDDLKNNERYFRIDENFLNESEELVLKVSAISSDINYPNFAHAVSYLDTLYQLRRDLGDFNLQTAASHAASLTEKINQYLPGVESAKLSNEWTDLSSRIKDFRKKIDSSEKIRGVTSVSDRIKDFASTVTEYISNLENADKNSDINKASADHGKLTVTYQNFLKNFLITNKSALFRLSDQDSMILNLSNESFISPVAEKPYDIFIKPDSSDVKVESPILFGELKSKVSPIAEKIDGLSFLQFYGAYYDSLQSALNKGMAIKDILRRNLELKIKNAELQDKINKYKNSSEYTAYNDIQNFQQVVMNSRSYSDIKSSIEKARNAISIFQQLYDQNRFDENLDSLNAGIEKDFDEYNDVLNEVRHLPKEITLFDQQKRNVSAVLQEMKSASVDTKKLGEIITDLENAYIFASEGKTQTVYAVFSKDIDNFGYVTKGKKSWEEKNNEKKK